MSLHLNAFYHFLPCSILTYNLDVPSFFFDCNGWVFIFSLSLITQFLARACIEIIDRLRRHI